MTAPQDNNYTISHPSIDVTCLRCGVHIGNRAIHDQWHREQDFTPIPNKEKA